MITLAAVIFTWDGLAPIAAAVVACVGFLLWRQARTWSAPAARRAAAALKLLGVLALAFCLLDPLYPRQRARPGANQFVILADNSLGMQIKDRGSPITRASQLHALVTNTTSGWLSSLGTTFELRRYLFDSRVQSTPDYAEMRFDGSSTALAGALKTIADRFRGQPLAGILLLTDGNATDAPESEIDAAGFPPVYPVLFGADDSVKDVAVTQVSVTQSAFEDAPITVQASVTAAGYLGQLMSVQILDPNGTKVAEQSHRLWSNDGAFDVRLQFRPASNGVSFYRVRAAANQEWTQFEQADASSEATLANNTRLIVVDRGRGPYRILYVAGRPNWEFKFLNRALAEDDQVRLAALIRVAKREPKFEFRGRAGESSNPLFRGFGNQSPEEVERYDQPVLIRLNTRDAAELAGGFPKKPEDLMDYCAVILDDVEAGFFSHDQMTLLQRFVAERGGGLLMLGGLSGFRDGQYQQTPIGDLLPVYLDSVEETRSPEGLHLNLTREGWLQPWARVRRTEGEERTRLESMPPFLVWNVVRGAKPGASVIATAADANGRHYPAIIAQRYGQGRVAAITLGDLWRWGLKDTTARADLDRTWRQTIRWLIADVPARVHLETRTEPGSPSHVRSLNVMARDPLFQPLENASVSVRVRELTREADPTSGVQFHAEPSLTDSGRYTAAYVSRESGAYLAEATVTGPDGTEIGKAETGWAADPLAEEFRSSKPNRALMAALARQTGGRVIAPQDLDGFARDLPNRPAPITETFTAPLWHNSWMLALALACLSAEWGIRRWKGLA
jgi:uncharacterized membrane protein